MKAAGIRAVRVGDHIQREIAVLLMRRVRDPRVEGVTVTGVRVSADLRMARVFFSVMGGQEDIRRAQAGLDSARGFIRREMGHHLEMKYVPEIMFVHDASLEMGRHLEQLLDEIGRGGMPDD